MDAFCLSGARRADESEELFPACFRHSGVPPRFQNLSAAGREATAAAESRVIAPRRCKRIAVVALPCI
jgi:hypothetical protein